MGFLIYSILFLLCVVLCGFAALCIAYKLCGFDSDNIRTIEPYHLSYSAGRGYLQTINKPPRHFAVQMDSGRLGIMKTDKIECFRDFGQACYSVDFHFTGQYAITKKG